MISMRRELRIVCGRLAWVRKISDAQNCQINEKGRGHLNQPNNAPTKKIKNKKSLKFYNIFLNPYPSMKKIRLF